MRLSGKIQHRPRAVNQDMPCRRAGAGVAAEGFIDGGGRAVVTAHVRGRGRASGVTVETRFYEVYTLRDDKVVRVDEFTDRAEALEVAGLSEQAGATLLLSAGLTSQ